MKRILIEFTSLTAALFIFNVLSYIAGMLLVEDFETYVYSHIQVIDELVIIALFVPFFLLAIRFYKKGGIFIFSFFNVLLGILLLHIDSMDTGWEIVSSFVYLISKFNHLLSVLIDFEGWQKINVTFIWGFYIVIVGYSYVVVKNKILQKKKSDNQVLTRKQ